MPFDSTTVQEALWGMGQGEWHLLMTEVCAHTHTHTVGHRHKQGSDILDGERRVVLERVASCVCLFVLAGSSAVRAKIKLHYL